LGVFTEGSVLSEEGLQIAEEMTHTPSLMIASWGCGFLALRQGEVARALSRLEVAIDIVQEVELLASFPLIAACLGMTYTLSGHIANALPLLRQAMAQTISRERMDLQALCRLALGEAHMVAGRLDEADTQAQRALEFSRVHRERGHEPYALGLLGECHARREPPEVKPAATFY